MSIRCCNPKCNAPFDYRQGRLIRISRPASGGNINLKPIEHVWICGRCSCLFVLEHTEGARVNLRPRELNPCPESRVAFASA